jgi:hypothetical protein
MNVKTKSKSKKMERSSLKRIDNKINAEVKIDGKYYEGSIENIYEEGLFEIVFPEIKVTALTPKKLLEVKFHQPSKEDLDLECKIVWLRLNKDSPAKLKYCMGMEIISPLESLKKFEKFSNNSISNPFN